MLYTKPGFFSQVLVSADSVATSQLRPLRLCHSVMMEIEFLVSMPVPDESPVAKPGLLDTDETSWQTPYHCPSLRAQEPGSKVTQADS